MTGLIKRTPGFFRPLRPAFGSLFDDFWGDWPTRAAGDSDVASSWIPAVDIRESGEALTVTAELPGLEKKDISVSLEDNVLTLTGERSFENVDNQETCHRIERRYGKFSRSFRLSSAVDNDKVEATFKDGLLTLVLPKTEEAKPRTIAIN